MDQAPLRELRAEVCAGLAGEIVEIGFGSGANVPFYPSTVTGVRAVDPAALGWELAADRLATSTVPVELVGLDGQTLPVADDTAAAVLCTWTLCTIPDATLALAEIRRVLAPGGALHFVEHGLAHQERGRTAQRRLTPLWKHVAGGCHLDRPIDRLITDAGFDVDVRTFTMKGPKTFGSTYLGTARPS
ncbi:MAG: class I SAM-dependent methyltransferase [Acidimicrobiia bacterium]|nr:class I SAM-dependent methyltransferase [Acidimicrobiia bacterium]